MIQMLLWKPSENARQGAGDGCMTTRFPVTCMWGAIEKKLSLCDSNYAIIIIVCL